MRTVAAACLLILLAGSVRGETRVDATLEPLDLEVGGRAVLTITVEGGGSIDGDPRWSLPEGLSVRSAGESRNFTMVNGKFSQSTERRYVVTPMRAGQFEFPAFDVRVSGRAYSFGPWTLSAAAGRAPQAPDRSLPPGQPPRGQDPPVRVEMSIEPEQLVLGQQAILSIRFLQRTDVTVYDARFIPPETEGFWKEELPQVPRGIERRGAASYDVTEVRLALFPTRAGRLEISPARVRVQYRLARRDPFSLFGFSGPDREEEPASGGCAVVVKPLPQPAPPEFAGAVGSFSVRASLDPETGVQGEPVNWTVEIAGQGNVAALQGPAFPEVPGCRGLDGGTVLDRSRDTRVIGGTKKFTRILIPDRAGAIRIPEVAWAHYDPLARRYVREELPGRSLSVTPAPDAPANSAGEAQRIGGGLRPIYTATRLRAASSERPWTSPGYLSALAVPLLAVASAWAVRRRRDLDRLDPAGARLRSAPRKLRASLAAAGATADPWGTLARAVEDFLAAQFGSEIRGLTRADLRARLAVETGDVATADRIVGVLEQADGKRYLPSSGSSEAEFREATRVVAETANMLKRGRRA